MTLSEFIANLSRLNNGEDFPKDVLKSIYISLKHQPLPYDTYVSHIKTPTQTALLLYTVSQKTVQNCFCQNFVKFPPILIIFGRKMAKGFK